MTTHPLRLQSMFALLGLAGLAAATGCAVSSDRAEDEAVDETAIDNELTSVSALSRTLKFQGRVYVADGASDFTILSEVRSQTQTAFGALRTAQIGVNSRELKEVDPKTFVKTKVVVVDAAGAKTNMLRVEYTYTDLAVVPRSFSRRNSLSLAVMGNDYQMQSDRILTECTDNDSEARDFQSSIWYVFNPSLSGCRAAITTEQKAIDAVRQKLATGSVPRIEVDRLYLPVTVSLGADKTNKGNSYPEYDRLYAGGVKPGKLVVSLVNGLLDHGEASNIGDDSGYGEWLQELREIFKGRPEFKLVTTSPSADVTTYTVGGKTITGVTFDKIISWKLGGTGLPTNLTSTEKTELQNQIADKVSKRWLTFEAPVKVTIGGVTKDVGLQILTYFGADHDAGPHKLAIKNSDVYLYNGHSYIGYGPLDPSNFRASDFPSSYQILFIDGCVSYNYYHKDYIPLKQGGTRNLDLITNGLEAPSWHSGYALGRFVARLLDGKQASYRDLLTAASDTDSLRVVDGETDNTYNPTSKPITVVKK
ncbi:MAG: hypothetical protein ABI175_14280 [Polyangiales bacterium]